MKLFIFFFAIVFTNLNLFSQNEFPKVTFLPDGTDAILFDWNQLAAVNGVIDGDRNPEPWGDHLNGRKIEESKKDEMEKLRRSGYLQSQYACWGDLNNDGLKDFLITIVEYNDSSNYTLAVFHGQRNGEYLPTKIHTFQSPCFYFITYNKNLNVITINDCKDGGLISWNGKKYVFTPLKDIESQDLRMLWVYDAGWYEKKEGKIWIEVNRDIYNTIGKIKLKEVNRTDNYVELYDESRKLSIRLYESKMEWRENSKDKWNFLYNGHWKK